MLLELACANCSTDLIASEGENDSLSLKATRGNKSHVGSSATSSRNTTVMTSLVLEGDEALAVDLLLKKARSGACKHACISCGFHSSYPKLTLCRPTVALLRALSDMAGVVHNIANVPGLFDVFSSLAKQDAVPLAVATEAYKTIAQVWVVIKGSPGSVDIGLIRLRSSSTRLFTITIILASRLFSARLWIRVQASIPTMTAILMTNCSVASSVCMVLFIIVYR